MALPVNASISVILVRWHSCISKGAPRKGSRLSMGESWQRNQLLHPGSIDIPWPPFRLAPCMDNLPRVSSQPTGDRSNPSEAPTGRPKVAQGRAQRRPGFNGFIYFQPCRGVIRVVGSLIGSVGSGTITPLQGFFGCRLTQGVALGYRRPPLWGFGRVEWVCRWARGDRG